MEAKEDIIPFRVFVRIRPLSDKERIAKADKIVRYEDKIVNFR